MLCALRVSICGDTRTLFVLYKCTHTTLYTLWGHGRHSANCARCVYIQARARWIQIPPRMWCAHSTSSTQQNVELRGERRWKRVCCVFTFYTGIDAVFNILHIISGWWLKEAAKENFCVYFVPIRMKLSTIERLADASVLIVHYTRGGTTAAATCYWTAAFDEHICTAHA